MVDQGRIIERGTHEELLAARGLYYELYESQFRRQHPALEAPGEEGKATFGG